MGEFHASLQSTGFRTPLIVRVLAFLLLAGGLAWCTWADNEAKDKPRADMCAELGRKLELGKLVPLSIFAAALDAGARFDCVDKHGDRWNAKEYGLDYSGSTRADSDNL